MIGHARLHLVQFRLQSVLLHAYKIPAGSWGGQRGNHYMKAAYEAQMIHVTSIRK